MICRILLLLLVAVSVNAQDKLFYANGEIRNGKLVRIDDNQVFFIFEGDISVRKIPNSSLLMVESSEGSRYLFSETDQNGPAAKDASRINYLGIQPLDLIFGRATVVYERYDEMRKLSFAFPVSITFDPYGTIYPLRKDSFGVIPHLTGIKFIVGADLLYYPQKAGLFRFFVGPRIRYGYNMFIENIQAFTFQTQAGWRIQEPGQRFCQHLSVGLGFVQVLDSRAGGQLDKRQAYPWLSINYRLGFRF
jgi:hypothetical protein